MQARSYDMEITLSQETLQAFENYLKNLQNSNKTGFKAGQRLTYVLQHSDLAKLTTHDLIDAFMKTLKPCVYAESVDQVKGDGRDWTNEEMQLMGRLVPVKTVKPYFNNTFLATFEQMNQNLPNAEMLFTHGGLLNNTQPDLSRIVFNNQVSDDLYLKFMEENFLPGFIYANEKTEPGKAGVITLPVLGGRAFAGPYAEQINNRFFNVLYQMLDKHKGKLGNIKHVVLTGHSQDSSFPVPSSSINLTTTTQAAGFYPYHLTRTTPENSKLFVCVAADHVAFPGNDGWSNQTTTHEGGTCMKARGLYDEITGFTQQSDFFSVQTATAKGVFVNDIGLYPTVQTNENPPRNYTWQELFVMQGKYVSAKYLYVNGQPSKVLQPNPAYRPQPLDLLAPAFYLENQQLSFSCFTQQAQAQAQAMPAQNQPVQGPGFFPAVPLRQSTKVHLVEKIGDRLCFHYSNPAAANQVFDKFPKNKTTAGFVTLEGNKLFIAKSPAQGKDGWYAPKSGTDVGIYFSDKSIRDLAKPFLKLPDKAIRAGEASEGKAKVDRSNNLYIAAKAFDPAFWLTQGLKTYGEIETVKLEDGKCLIKFKKGEDAKFKQALKDNNISFRGTDEIDIYKGHFGKMITTVLHLPRSASDSIVEALATAAPQIKPK